MDWVTIPSKPLPIDLDESLLPSEGLDIQMKTIDGSIKFGFFLWSSEYVFLEIIDDESEEVHNVNAWRYL